MPVRVLPGPAVYSCGEDVLVRVCWGFLEPTPTDLDGCVNVRRCLGVAGPPRCREVGLYVCEGDPLVCGVLTDELGEGALQLGNSGRGAVLLSLPAWSPGPWVVSGGLLLAVGL